MPDLNFGCLPTIIGTMPHTDPAAACSLILKYLKDIPAWPQLPKRGFLENMYAQFSEGFPGVMIRENSIYVNRAQDLDKPLETLYSAYLENDIDKFPITPQYAAGLHYFLGLKKEITSRAVKGQIVGPVTWGSVVMDNTKKAIIYDDTLSDAIARLLRLKAGWMEKKLRELNPNTIIFVDEPSMSTFGSSFFQVSKEKVIKLIDEVLGGISGAKGIHCCGNTDWTVLLATTTDIISFDAYNYGQSLSLYPREVKQFLAKGKAISWGIVPNEAESLAKESVASLKDRLEETMAPFTRDGIHFKDLLRQSLLTPSCGLASLTIEESARVLELLADVSQTVRRQYL